MTNPKLNWPLAPAKLPAGARDIHVFAASLSLPPECLTALAATLSPDEQARVARLKFELVRHRFIAARGILRAILGRCLGCPPAALKFDYSPRGKPALAGADAPHFNLAHSADLALIAVTRLCPVGVDVEYLLRAMNDAEAIARRFFSPRESAAFNALPADKKTAAFFNLWTRKEAWLKATGEGIGEFLSQVEVSFLPKEPARFIGLPDNAGAPEAWSLHALDPAPGYVGALATTVRDAQLHCWRWDA